MSGTEPAGRSRGRTRITSRALDRVASAVSADALGVDVKSVSVDLADGDGMLRLTVTAPIRVVSLARVHQGSAVIARTGGTVLERAALAQENIRSGVASLTGYSIGSVIVRLSGADIQKEERVK